MALLKVMNVACPSSSLFWRKYGFKDFDELKAYNNSRALTLTRSSGHSAHRL